MRTTTAQAVHLFTEALEEFGVRATSTPPHPRMGILVQETAAQAAAILAAKSVRR